MKYTDNALNILTAKSFKMIGDAWIAKHWDSNLPYEAVVELLQKHAKEEVTEELFINVKNHIRNKIEKLKDSCDGITALGDPDFPKHRGLVNEGDKPNVLFYKGDLNLLSQENKNIAVIGVLTPDEKTEQDERKMVDFLAKKGAIIVSGLALGCDRIAHHQSLVSKSTTVAILPSPLNNIIPKECIPLAEYIGKNGGLLITEYYDAPESPRELSGRYIRRDRLQALFSDMVILTASYTPNSVDPKAVKIDSGSRHAMEKAKSYGLKRGVMYSSYNDNNPQFDLNRQIKSDQEVIVIDPNRLDETTERIFVNESAQESLF